MTTEILPVPDVGTDAEVEVVEVLVAEGGRVEIDDPVVVLETDKASVEVPATRAGTVASVALKVGDKVKTGDTILDLSLEGENSEAVEETKAEELRPLSQASANEAQADAAAKPKSKVSASPSSSVEKVLVPDVGGAEEVEVIELSVAEGDVIEEDQALLVLESDKASMDIPSPFAGTVKKLALSVGDKVGEGDLILELEIQSKAEKQSDPPDSKESNQFGNTSKKETTSKHESAVGSSEISQPQVSSNVAVHAGPAVRKLARELGVDLERVAATGPKGRIQKDDLNEYIKAQVTAAQNGLQGANAAAAIELPDFSQFGEVELSKLSKIQLVTAKNMSASWNTVPHVTQFDEADITELEAFRKAKKHEADAQNLKLTPVPFLLLSCAKVLEALPQFNVSLDLANQQLIQKKYIHIGLAVDTPYGLVVPVVRDVLSKNIWQLSEEVMNLADKAKNRKLSPQDMQGACFTISSLGGIGGTAFTPIVNMPEVSILGVSKAQYKPVYIDGEFVPRLMLPLSLSYDHRAVNGADGARFTSLLARYLSDLRELLF